MNINNKYFCNKCKRKFIFENDRYICKNCKKIIPIEANIPRFVETDIYAGNFSFQWNIHKRTQFDDKVHKISEDTFFRRFGLEKEFFHNKDVLEVGVGNGRYAEIPLKYGSNLYGIDLSSSVDSAYSNLKPKYKSLNIAQADLQDLPFEDCTFDVIYAFGVLHHTPDPELSFNKLVPLLKKDGVICITVYPEYGMYKNSLIVRKITNNLHPYILYPIILILVLILYIPYKYLLLRHTFLGKIFPIGINDSIFEAILVTYDCYSPKYQFCYAAHEIFSWYKKAGLSNIEVRPDPTTLIGYKK